MQVLRKYQFVLLMVAVALVFAVSAEAAQPDNYAAVRIGTAMPAGDLDDADLDSGPYVELAFGHYFNPNFALEGSIGATVMSTPGDYDYEIYPVQINAKGILPLDNAELYGMFGIGVYHVYSEYHDNSNTLFGYDFGVGGLLKVSNSFGIGLELKHFWVEEADWGTESEANTLTANFQFYF